MATFHNKQTSKDKIFKENIQEKAQATKENVG
jgi:hypothetical protein